MLNCLDSFSKIIFFFSTTIKKLNYQKQSMKNSRGRDPTLKYYKYKKLWKFYEDIFQPPWNERRQKLSWTTKKIL